MSITVNWATLERSALRFVADGAWTWDEMLEATWRALDMVDGVRHNVHYIIDLSADNALPPDNAFSNFRLNWQIMGRHPRSGHLFIVNPSRVGRMMGDIFLRVYAGPDAGRMTFVPTVDAALAEIRRASEGNLSQQAQAG